MLVRTIRIIENRCSPSLSSVANSHVIVSILLLHISIVVKSWIPFIRFLTLYHFLSLCFSVSLCSPPSPPLSYLNAEAFDKPPTNLSQWGLLCGVIFEAFPGPPIWLLENPNNLIFTVMDNCSYHHSSKKLFFYRKWRPLQKHTTGHNVKISGLLECPTLANTSNHRSWIYGTGIMGDRT